MDAIQEQAEASVIADGNRVEAFVKDPAVQAAVARLATQYYTDFKRADTDTKMIQANAKSKVLDDLMNELQITIDRGEGARINRKERERREKGQSRTS